MDKESFTSGKPWFVTQKDLTLSWSGGKDGIYFKCHLCGHKFGLNDIVRFVYCNSFKNGKGNVLVCKDCDGTNEEVNEKYNKVYNEYRSEKFWSFRRK